MAIYYCKTCGFAGAESEMKKHAEQWVCPKCKVAVHPLGKERGKVSQSVTVNQDNLDLTLKGEAITGKLGNVDLIVMECEDILKQDPHDQEALLTLAKRYYVNQDFDTAKSVCSKLLVLEPEHKEATVLLNKIESPASQEIHLKTQLKKAREALLKGDFEQVKAYCHNCLDQADLVIDARKLLAEMHQMKGDFKSSLMELEKLIKLAPKDPYLFYNIGLIFLHQQDNENAKKYLEKAKGLSTNKTFIQELDQQLEALN